MRKKKHLYKKQPTVIWRTTLGFLETFPHYISINMLRKIIVIIKEKNRRIVSSVERACWRQARALCTSPYTLCVSDCRSLLSSLTVGLGAQRVSFDMLHTKSKSTLGHLSGS